MSAYRTMAAPPPKTVGTPALAGGRAVAVGVLALGLAVLVYGNVDDVALDCTRVDGGGEMRCGVRAGLASLPAFRVRRALAYDGARPEIIVLHDSDEGIHASDLRERIEGPTALRDELRACVGSGAPRCELRTIPTAGRTAAWAVFVLSLLLATLASMRYEARVVADRVSRSLRLQLLVGRRAVVDRPIDEVPLLISARPRRGFLWAVVVRDEASGEETVVALTTRARASEYARRIYEVARWSRALAPDALAT